MAAELRTYDVAPRAARLTNSMRDIGYDFPTAVADLVDNSIAAGAKQIDIIFEYQGQRSFMLLADDGMGMTRTELTEALRFGSRSTYDIGDLGRFGLGLKTASLSQCRRLTVASKSRPGGRTSVRRLDLDLIDRRDEWIVFAPRPSGVVIAAREILAEGTGTVVAWESLDRALPDHMATNGWGRRRWANLALRTAEHLGMVFHRFLTGEASRRVRISVDGLPVVAWDPFARAEQETTQMPEVVLEIPNDRAEISQVRLRRYILPPRELFSSQDAFDRLSGPLKWNRMQGFYIYRADRLVQAGGWGGLRGIDEHTKLARVALDFNTDLDKAFQINVAKMRVIVPPSIRQLLERPVHEVCIQANDVYRRQGSTHPKRKGGASTIDLTDVGLAIRSAALESGHLAAIAEVESVLRRRSPEMSRALGFI